MDHYKKILIIQSYNPNKGDNSVVGIMLSSLKKYDYDISITAFDPNKAKQDYHTNAFDYLLSFRRAKLASDKIEFLLHVVEECLWMCYSFLWLLLFRLKINLPLPKGKKEIIEAYKTADLIVLPGGHFFTSFNSFINNFSHYYALRYAQLLGKKNMVYAQTVGPFKRNIVGRLEQTMANRVLRRTRLVTLREADSLKYYSGKNVEVTAESVFIESVLPLNINITKYITINEGEVIIGVTIHHIYYKHYFSKEQYVGLMADIFNTILSKYKCRILMIPMEDNYKSGGDRPIIFEMISRVDGKYRGRISMVTDDLSSTETANIISHCSVFVGTKTHSIVYGLKTATPTLSISYQEKSTEFMKMFGVGENAIAMNQLNQADFMILFDRVYQNREATKCALQITYPRVKEAAIRNNVLLNQLMDAL
jgi:colanic acid/amylovoran biosynthesis protein